MSWTAPMLQENLGADLKLPRDFGEGEKINGTPLLGGTWNLMVIDRELSLGVGV